MVLLIKKNYKTSPLYINIVLMTLCICILCELGQSCGPMTSVIYIRRLRLFNWKYQVAKKQEIDFPVDVNKRADSTFFSRQNITL